jgi:hypothetical protein
MAYNILADNSWYTHYVSERNEVHVVPIWEHDHTFSPECECKPALAVGSQGVEVYRHKRFNP